MANAIKLIGVFFSNGRAIQAKTQQTDKVTHFVDKLNDYSIVLDAKTFALTTAKGSALPNDRRIANERTFWYNKSQYRITVRLKKIVGDLTFESTLPI